MDNPTKHPLLPVSPPPPPAHSDQVLTGEDEEDGEQRDQRDPSPGHLEPEETRPRLDLSRTPQLRQSGRRGGEKDEGGREGEREVEWEERVEKKGGREGSSWNFNCPREKKRSRKQGERDDGWGWPNGGIDQ